MDGISHRFFWSDFASFCQAELEFSFFFLGVTKQSNAVMSNEKTSNGIKTQEVKKIKNNF